jgi:hypothetical protein
MAKYTHQWLCQQIVDNTGDAIIFGDGEGMVRLERRRGENVRISRRRDRGQVDGLDHS